MKLTKIREIVSTKTFSQSFLVSSSTVVNGALGVIFYLSMARFLGVVNFGVFFMSITIVSLISDVSKLGIDTGIVNFVARNIEDNKILALKFLKLSLKILVVTSIIVILVGWIITPFVSQSLFSKSELAMPFRVALFGVLTSSLFIFSTSSLQAIQKFWTWGILNILMNLTRLIFVVCLFVFGLLTISSALSVYVLIPFVGFLISLIFLPNFLNVKNENKVSSDFFKFNKWVIVFTIISAIGSRLDTLLTGRFLSLNDLGIYSVAVNLTSVIPQIVVAIASVVAPKLTKFDNQKAVIKYLKKLQLFVVILSIIGFLAGTFFGYYLINNYYGINYINSFFPYLILLVAQIIFFISIPVHTAVLYYFSYPKLFFYTTFINLIIILMGGYIFIPIYGYIGASIVVLFGNLSNFLIPLGWVFIKFKIKK